MKISVNIVTFNEADKLERCLKSVSFADEIIIVDSKSTDKTISIAKKYTKKIYFRDFTGFSDIKNHAILKSKNEWILSIDADEEISQELKNEIKKIVKSKDAADGYLIKRNTFFLGREIKHCGWGRDYQLRLFRKSKGRFNNKIVHEGVAVKGRVVNIEHPLYHYSYPDSATYFEKLNRYTSLQAVQKQKDMLMLRMLTAPALKFFRMYFLKLGFLDGVQGFVLCAYSGFSEFVKFSKMLEEKKKVKKDGIILRSPNWIGDAVMSTALLPSLKGEFKRLVVVAPKQCARIFEGSGYIDELIIFDKKKAGSFINTCSKIRRTKIRTGITLTPSISSGFMLWFSGLKVRAGFSEDGLFLNRKFKRDKAHSSMHLIDEFKEVVCKVSRSISFSNVNQSVYADKHSTLRVLKKFKIQNSKFKIVIAPFVQYGPAKMWPLKYWEELLKGMFSENSSCSIIMIGTKDDMNFQDISHKRIIDLRGKTDIDDVVSIIASANLFIGNDSGLMHIADALKVPGIVLFASTSRRWTGPVSKEMRTIKHEVFCSPCFDKECRFDNYKCLNELKPADVMKEIRKIVRKK